MKQFINVRKFVLYLAYYQKQGFQQDWTVNIEGEKRERVAPAILCVDLGICKLDIVTGPLI